MINVFVLCSIAIIVVGTGYYIYSSYNKNTKESISFKAALDLTDLPIITMFVGTQKVNLLLDTGSTNSIIDKRHLEYLKHEQVQGTNDVCGMEGNLTKANNVSIVLNYNNSYFTSNFLTVDMAQAFDRVKEETGVTLHGILGTEFFNRYKYVIDFNKLIAVYKKNK